MIEYVDVRKTFDAPVLAGVSITIFAGERLAIVGPSGTGKSVLLKTAAGLIMPDTGDVLIDGLSVVHASKKELRHIRSKVGYVFQNAALFDSITVFENLLLGIPEDTLRSLSRRDLIERAVAALTDVNLDAEQVFNKFPAELSGGMKKRVGLARATIGRPEIILYDEPVTGLDPVNSATVTHLIVRITENVNATSIIVTHDIEGALEFCDRIALLDEGVFRFVGTPNEFRSSNDPLVRAFADRRSAEAAARRLAGAARDG